MKRLVSLLLAALLLLPCARAQEAAYAALESGSTGPAVEKLQQRLIELGFLRGAADGRYGGATRKAVLAFQSAMRDQGVNVGLDGIAGPKTQAALYDEKLTDPLLTLRIGAKGGRVSDMQTALYDLNLLSDAPDGLFGPNTERAVKALQTHLVNGGAEGVQVNGVWDAATRAAVQGGLSRYGIKAPAFYDGKTKMTGEYLYARSAILIDAHSGEVLFEKDADARRYPASTTKMMTLLLALEKGGLDSTVKLPRQTNETPKGSSLVPVYYGEEMTMRDLLYGLMLRSGNDAANAVAVLLSKTAGQFVDAMNARAQALGLSATHFVNPHGYHDKQHYTTARDLAALGKALLMQPEAKAIVSAPHHEMAATSLRDKLLIENGADILLPLSPYYYPGAIGIKSGYTSQAGFCFVGAAERDGKRLIAVVLNCRTRDKAWTDLKHLFNLGFGLSGR